jgi:hypothetical protein
LWSCYRQNHTRAGECTDSNADNYKNDSGEDLASGLTRPPPALPAKVLIARPRAGREVKRWTHADHIILPRQDDFAESPTHIPRPGPSCDILHVSAANDNSFRDPAIGALLDLISSLGSDASLGSLKNKVRRFGVSETDR